MATFSNPTPILGSEVDKQTETPVEYISMRSVFFAFIDILGFKNSFDVKNKESGRWPAKKYKDVFSYFFTLMGAANFMKSNGEGECYAGQTSDILYFYTSRVDFLMEFIKIFTHFNLYAMSQDVFFRGGIAKGELHHKEKYQFYGDSVINAYLLESEISKNPIVVIDDNTYEEIKGYKECEYLIGHSGERHYINPFVALSKDINLDIEDKDLAEVKEINKSKVIKEIQRNKRLFEYDSRNFDKYVFLESEYKKTGEINC